MLQDNDQLASGFQKADQASITDTVASAFGCSRVCDERLLLLTLEWLDAADLMVFDTATQSNRRMASAWLRVIRSHVDIRPMRGLLYTPLWIRWMIDRGVRTSSMRIAGRTITDRVTDATFEDICLPELTSIEVSDLTLSPLASKPSSNPDKPVQSPPTCYSHRRL